MIHLAGENIASGKSCQPIATESPYLKKQIHTFIYIYIRIHIHIHPPTHIGDSALGPLAVLGTWTEAKKNKILSSRVEGTKLLVDTIATLKTKPKVNIVMTCKAT